MGGSEAVASPRILTVLRGGGEYLPEHVRRLWEMCAEHAPGVAFDCLTDGDGLRHGWPGWWSKMEVFRVRGPALYIDLDTTIVASIAPLLDAAKDNDFIALRDFNPHQRDMGSGLMAWRGDLSWLYDRFAQAPVQAMESCRSRRWFGDQGYIDRNIGPRAYWQEILPGAVVSYKKHCRGGVPAGARVVCHHGKPRPWEVE